MIRNQLLVDFFEDKKSHSIVSGFSIRYMDYGFNSNQEIILKLCNALLKTFWSW